MAQTTVAGPESSLADTGQVVNDVVIKIATANGSGSQSANMILMRSIFDMGVPVSGKNLFPSNIQGLPTWYTIRANEKGWVSQRRRTDIFIAMNPDTVTDDIAECDPGTTLIIRDTLKGLVRRDDLNVVAAPFDALVKKACDDTRLQKKVVNVIYVGIAAYLLDISLDCVHEAIGRQFGKKPKAIELNNAAADVGYAWAEETLSGQSNFVIRPCKKAAGKILIEGNQATALGLLFGGFHVAAWYPITPSSSVAEYLARFARKYRSEPGTGKATYAIVQAEDELAAIGMVLGAGWAGARSVTATSGPGISLMAEMAGLSYFAEIPAVIVDVQRMGPSTGLPTRNSQGDIAKAYYLSHGDCRHVLLIPGNVQECYEFAMKALDLAEQLQTLVFLMTDLDFGMNSWMADPFPAPADPLERGKVLDADALAKVEDWGRYRDVDGDGVPYRTLPGTPHPNAAYFTRGTGHDEYARYSEKPEVWQGNMDRLLRKFDTARTLVPKPMVDVVKGAEVGIIAYGSSDPAVEEARDMLLRNHGLKTNYLRLRALPMSEDVRTFIERQKIVYVVEQNRDAQVKGILLTEYPQLGTRLDGVLHYTGIPIDAESIAEKIIEKYGK